MLRRALLLAAELTSSALGGGALNSGGYGGLGRSRLAARDEAHAVRFGCEHAPQSAMGFCNASLGTDARIADLLGRLTVDEKLNLLGTGNTNVTRLGIGSYSWWTEVLHGVFGGFGGASGVPNAEPARPTIFPNGVGLSASFDAPLLQAVGGAIGAEQRALNNAVLDEWGPSSTPTPKPPDMYSGSFQGINGYAPNCNLYRDPRWGRAQETYGESVRQISELCAAYIRGLQGNHSKYLQLASTVKHYAFYSGPECDGHDYVYKGQRGGCKEYPGIGRGNFNAVVDAQDSFQSYLLRNALALPSVSCGSVC